MTSLEHGGADVHVWVRHTSAIDAAALTALASSLSDEERARCERLRMEDDRRDFAAAHVLLRYALSACGPLAPPDWQFEHNDAGHPRVVGGQAGTPPLVFSLTHTRGLVACAVTHGLAVGIDAERVRPVPGAQHIADTRFASAEATMLGACDAATIDARFLELWTLKEAYSKAVGLGLHLPLDAHAFGFTDGGGLTFEARELNRGWGFWLADVDGHYRLALAVHTMSGHSPVVSFNDADGRTDAITVVRTGPVG